MIWHHHRSRLTLQQRLLMTALMPALLLLVVLGLYFWNEAIESTEHQWQQRGLDIVRHLAPTTEYGVLSGNGIILQSLVDATVDNSDIQGMVITSADGKILAMGGKIAVDNRSLLAHLDAPQLVGTTPHGASFAAPIARSPAVAQDLFATGEGADSPPDHSAAEQAQWLGKVVIQLDHSSVEMEQQRLLMQGSIVIIVATLIVTFLVVRMAQNLSAPISRLAEVAQAMGDGQFDRRVEESSGGEIGALERVFNQMAKQIADIHRTLQERIDEATAQLAFQARHDPLTGLINRREFETRLEAALQLAQSGYQACCVLFIDLDRFKRVNDVGGHLAGDELLRRIARQLENRLRDTDTLARLGGDEFAAILPGSTPEQASLVANELCQLVAQYPFYWKNKVFSIGASIGLVLVDGQHTTLTDILAEGDAACYAAKSAGRNRVEVYSQSDIQHNRASDMSPICERLEKALANDWLCYQVQSLLPTHAMPSRQHQWVELSQLLADSDMHPALPLELMMESAERCELAHLFDLERLRQAAELLSLAPAKTLVMVQLSGSGLRHPGYLAQLHETLRLLGEARQSLCLLVSETTAIEFPADTEQLRHLLQEAEACFGLDDFGGVIGRFDHLDRLHPDYIRVTPTLTRNISEHRNAAALIKAIQEIAHDHGSLTIASGVDQSSDRDILQRLGVNFLQGSCVEACQPMETWLVEHPAPKQTS